MYHFVKILAYFQNLIIVIKLFKKKRKKATLKLLHKQCVILKLSLKKIPFFNIKEEYIQITQMFLHPANIKLKAIVQQTIGFSWSSKSR